MDEKTLKSIIGNLYCDIVRAQEIIQSLQQGIAEKQKEIDALNRENAELRISRK